MTDYRIPLATRGLIEYVELVSPYFEDPTTMMRVVNGIVDLTNEVVDNAVNDALDNAESPFRRIMDEQSAELASVYGELHAQREQRNDLHEVLVNVARQDAEVIRHLNESHKIYAIKRMRQMTNCDLKAAKEAVEDPRVRMCGAMFVVVGETTI